MLDSWDNPTSVVPSAERIKQLRERKLVEESDNALTCELFGAPKVVEIGSAIADTKQPSKKKKLGHPPAKAQKTV